MRITPDENFNVKIITGNKPVELIVNVGTSANNSLLITAYDTKIKNTVLFRRIARPKHTSKEYKFGIPVTKEFFNLLIKSENPEYAFDVNKIKVNPIKEFEALNFVNDEQTIKFQNFIKEFCYNFGNYNTGIRQDKDGLFKIQILEDISDTPTRIGEITNIIQVSKRAFDTATVSQRALMLAHEYSHNYKNEDPDDEFEADINGLKIYLSMKYPVIEAYNTFLSLTPNIFSYERLLNAERFLLQYESKLKFDNE